jgi:hypothetical protein
VASVKGGDDCGFMKEKIILPFDMSFNDILQPIRVKVKRICGKQVS